MGWEKQAEQLITFALKFVKMEENYHGYNNDSRGNIFLFK